MNILFKLTKFHLVISNRNKFKNYLPKLYAKSWNFSRCLDAKKMHILRRKRYTQNQGRNCVKILYFKIYLAPILSRDSMMGKSNQNDELATASAHTVLRYIQANQWFIYLNIIIMSSISISPRNSMAYSLISPLLAL